MERIEILLFTPYGASDLGLSLKSALKDAPLFDFELREEAMPEERFADHTPILSSAVAHRQPNIVLLCLAQGHLKYVSAIFDRVREHLQAVPIIVATEAGEPKEMCHLLELGAADFITPPFRSIDLLPRLWRLHTRTYESDPVALKLKQKLGLKQILGESPALLAEIDKTQALAQCDASVLIAGETGTGKEMFARAIHYLSPRSRGPFIPVNCGAIPVDLLENELFGHEPGAFTGASSSRLGLINAADGGTLFLDEIDCLPLLAQVKLLRFLQEKEYRPLGSRKVCTVDIRVIAASNVNFEEAVRSGRFRSDLYYRLNVVQLALPPLRQRKEDIPLLARHFLVKYCVEFTKPPKVLSQAALRKLSSYEWPGNIRELQNVIARAAILSEQSAISSEDIRLPMASEPAGDVSFKALKATKIAEFEKGYLEQILRANDGNVTKAAKAAKQHPRAIWRLMHKYNIRVPSPVLR